jgi:hypothetical protein
MNKNEKRQKNTNRYLGQGRWEAYLKS